MAGLAKPAVAGLVSKSRPHPPILPPNIYNHHSPFIRDTILRMDFLKTIGGKIVSGLVAVAVIAMAISWWQMEPSTREMLLTGSGRILSWLLVMLVLPWVTFFLASWVAKFENNAAGAALVVGYTLAEAVLLAWLFRWQIHGATGIVFFCAATLLAGAYNLFACDWIAEKVG